MGVTLDVIPLVGRLWAARLRRPGGAPVYYLLWGTYAAVERHARTTLDRIRSGEQPGLYL